MHLNRSPNTTANRHVIKEQIIELIIAVYAFLIQPATNSNVITVNKFPTIKATNNGGIPFSRHGIKIFTILNKAKENDNNVRTPVKPEKAMISITNNPIKKIC